MKKFISVFCICIVAVSAFAEGHNSTWLTIVHSNDGESALLANDYSGSIAQFATVIESVVDEVGRDNAIVVSAGDNFLAGIEYAASEGVYDARALSHIGFDISAVGNHEFDFGPAGLERFLINTTFNYVTSNLDFRSDPILRRFADTKVFRHQIIKKAGRRIGFVGATTEEISYISSPGDVTINHVRESLQAAADTLRSQGVDIIIALTHLQNIEVEKALATQIRGIDVFVAGGGNDLIGNANNSYLTRQNRNGDWVQDSPTGPYPFRAISPEGEPVLVVATDGDYNYIGRLDVEFDRRGVVVEVGEKSGPIAIGVDITPNSTVQAEVVDAVAEKIAQFSNILVGKTVDGLDGTREIVRTQESTMGNAISDGYLYSANLAGVGGADFAFTNGGGIRRSIVIQKNGSLSKADLFTALPFANYLTIIDDMSAAEIKELFEHSVAKLPEAAGRFLQVSGVSVVYDSTLPAGSRVQSIRIGGDTLVSDGSVVSDATYNAITNSFLADGGDGYEVLDNISNTRKRGSGYSYAQGFELYLENQSPIKSPISGRLVDTAQ